MATVLLIETQEPLMRLMAWFLLEDEHRVTTASSLAIAAVRAADGPNVIVFNTHMEPDSKRGAIADMRATTPDSRILDIRDHEYPNADTGADAYLALPFDAYDLVAAVRALDG